MYLTLEFINGLKIGLEHISGEEEDDVEYVIALDLLIFRIGIVVVKELNET